MTRSGRLGWRLLAVAAVALATVAVPSPVRADSGFYYVRSFNWDQIFPYAWYRESGLASGINNSVFQVGAALGIALCTTVALEWDNWQIIGQTGHGLFVVLP